MRWYKLVTSGGDTWDATGDPYALNIELDIPVTGRDSPGQGAFVRVWGISLQTFLNSKKYNKQDIMVYGGMQQGLPLANPAQQGLLVLGGILPAWGNWVGTDMTLDFALQGPFGAGFPPQITNHVHNWMANTPLTQAIQQTLSTAYPGYGINMKISPQLMLNYTDTGVYQTLFQYRTYINQISKSIMGGGGGSQGGGATSSTYPGVDITASGKQFYVSDTTQGGFNTIQIQPQDLIGQPTWIGAKEIQVKCVMRGDIKNQDQIILPTTLATLTEGAALGASAGGPASNVISGSFFVRQIRHTGNFRQPDWASWATTLWAVQQ